MHSDGGSGRGRRFRMPTGRRRRVGDPRRNSGRAAGVRLPTVALTAAQLRLTRRAGRAAKYPVASLGIFFEELAKQQLPRELLSRGSG